jgi:hypothetical protein
MLTMPLRYSTLHLCSSRSMHECSILPLLSFGHHHYSLAGSAASILPKIIFERALTSQADSLNAISVVLTVLKAFSSSGVFFGPSRVFFVASEENATMASHMRAGRSLTTFDERTARD